MLLDKRRVAIAETRELDLFADMLAREGAVVVRCPLVAIHDAPDPAPVEAWLRRVIARTPECLVIYTGEGLRRLVSFADRAGLKADFIAALGRTRKIVRGPKPQRALREIGLTADVTAAEPTTAGVIATLESMDLAGRTVAVQLYGQEPIPVLFDFLEAKGAIVDAVAPYIYASAAEDECVSGLITRMAAGEIDAIAFTSSAQATRLFAVAEHRGHGAALVAGLAKAKVAAVGPVVAEELKRLGRTPDAVPESAFTLKPLVKTIAQMLAQSPA